MPSTTSSATVRVLRHQLVLDNGSKLTSEEFTAFLKSNGVREIHSAPYHPVSNGLLEQFVQTSKPWSLAHHLACPCSITWPTPFWILLHTSFYNWPFTKCLVSIGRKLCTCLDLLKSNCKGHVLSKQSKQAQQHNQHAKPRCFEVWQ